MMCVLADELGGERGDEVEVGGRRGGGKGRFEVLT